MTRDLRLVALSLMVWGIGEGMFFYFQPLYIQQLGADPLQIGAILGAAGLAMAVAHVPAGALADHFGRKGVMVVSWVSGMLAAWMMFLARSLPVFVIALLLYYLTAFVASPMSSYITAARGRWSVTRALTTVSAVFNAGGVLGPLIGGQLAERFGLHAVYGVAAALFVVSTAMVLSIRPQAPEPSPADSRYRALLTRGGYLGFLVLAFAVTFGMYLCWPLTPNYLQEVRAVTVGQIGVFGAFYALGVVVLNLTLGRLAPRRAFLIVQALMGMSAVLLWRGAAVPWFAVGYFLAGGLRTAHTLVTAQVQILVHRAEMGLAYGLAESVQGAALMASPPLAGYLYQLQPSFPYPVALGIIGAMLLLSAWLAPRAELPRSHLSDLRRE
jgi:MFS family permease